MPSDRSTIYPKFWLAEYNSRLGLAVMRQNSPTLNSQMIVSIVLPEQPAIELGKQIIAILEAIK